MDEGIKMFMTKLNSYNLSFCYEKVPSQENWLFLCYVSDIQNKVINHSLIIKEF